MLGKFKYIVSYASQSPKETTVHVTDEATEAQRERERHGSEGSGTELGCGACRVLPSGPRLPLRLGSARNTRLPTKGSGPLKRSSLADD